MLIYRKCSDLLGLRSLHSRIAGGAPLEFSALECTAQANTRRGALDKRWNNEGAKFGIYFGLVFAVQAFVRCRGTERLRTGLASTGQYLRQHLSTRSADLRIGIDVNHEKHDLQSF